MQIRNFIIPLLLIAFTISAFADFKGTIPNVSQNKLLSVNGFLENKGQIADQYGDVRHDVKYIYENNGLKFVLKTNSFSYELFHVEKTSTETTMASFDALPEEFRYDIDIRIHSHRIDILFEGANQNPKVIPHGVSGDYFNFYYPHTPNDGAVAVHYYDKVTYKNLYPNIDCIFYTTDNGLKYDIIVRPGGDIDLIKMNYKGADDLFLTPEGKLRIQTSEGFIEESIPLTFFLDETSGTGQNTNVNASFELNDKTVSFNVKDYNINKTLTIDPEIVWGTYYGGIERDVINAIQHDELNHIIGSGCTISTSNVATSGVYQTTFAGGSLDAFLVKLDYTGKRKWATYCGGDSLDNAYGVAADNVWHHLYIMGFTNSRNGLSSDGAYQEEYGLGFSDGFLAKFDQMGQRIWCTYYGGADAHDLIGGEYIYDAAIDKRFGDIYFTGAASSSRTDSRIASPGAHQTWLSGEFDAFLVKFTPDGERDWGTYYGGEEFDVANGITLDPSGYITIGGYTESNNFDDFDEELIATEGAFKETLSGTADGFIARFNLRGTRQWGTYYGGPNQDNIYCTAADKDKNIYIGGATSSQSGISTAGSHQSSFVGSLDGFIVKFSPTGTRLWGSYYGGTGADEITAMCCDSEDNLAFCGNTTSTNNIATAGSFQDFFIGAGGIDNYTDGFVAFFDPSGSRVWSSYIGDALSDYPNSIAIDLNENIIVAGYTDSRSRYGTNGTHQPNISGAPDAFILKIGEFIKITNLSTPFCIGTPISVSYESGIEINYGNVFIAQLSDNTGDFSHPVNIGSKASIKNGVIDAVIPAFTAPGTKYRIRILSTNPAKTSPDNGTDITIHELPVPVVEGDSPACSREHLTYTAALADDVVNLWSVTNGAIIGDSTLEDVVVAWEDDAEGSIKVIQTNTLTECSDSIEITIEINETPHPNIIGETEVVLNTLESYNTPTNSSLEFQWEVTGGTINNDATNNEIEVAWGSVGSGTVKLIVLHKNSGCMDSLQLTIAINPTPVKITGKKIVCANSSESYSITPSANIEYIWVANGGTVDGDAADSLVTITWGEPGSGIITLIRTNKQTLEKDSVITIITIHELPTVAILGIDEFCEGEISDYIAVYTKNVTTEWSVYNGTILDDITSDTVRIQWNNIDDSNDSSFVSATVFLKQTSLETGCSNIKEKIVYLSANPDAEIYGDFTACENSTEEYYTSMPDESNINEWFVEGGTILGSSDDSTLQVEWGTEGTGSLKLIQTSTTGCYDSSLVEIIISIKPAQPTITQTGKKLVSSAESGNQWFREGDLIEGATGKEYPPTATGDYTVQTTNIDGCESLISDPYSFNINSVEDLTYKKGICEVFPNPAGNFINIKFDNDFHEDFNLKLFDILGNEIISRSYKGQTNQDYTLNLQNLTHGIYFLHIKLNENNLYIYRIVKH